MAKIKGQRGQDSVRMTGGVEMPFPTDMLSLFQMKVPVHLTSPAQRKRICEVFGFMIKLANKYLPPKQRKIFYSVWVRSGGKMKEGVLEYSRKTGENYVTSYGNYYKAVKNLKIVVTRVGYDKFIIDYLKDGATYDED